MNNRENAREKERDAHIHTTLLPHTHTPTRPHPHTPPHMWRLCALCRDAYLHLICFVINDL